MTFDAILSNFWWYTVDKFSTIPNLLFFLLIKLLSVFQHAHSFKFKNKLKFNETF